MPDDQMFERSYLDKVVDDEAKSDQLISSLLPRDIAIRLKAGEQPIADQYSMVSVLFLDLEGFTAWTRDKSPELVVDLLNNIFSDLDKLVASHQVEKIKTIGDAYMVASGLGNDSHTETRTDHTARLDKNLLAGATVGRISELRGAPFTHFSFLSILFDKKPDNRQL